MEIGKINDTLINNTLDNTKNKVTDDSFESRLKNAMGTKDEKELKKACNDFEGIMMNMMYKEMKATIQKSSLMPKDSGTDIFNSMLDDELMKEASKTQGMGLADILYKQLSKQLKSHVKLDNGGAGKSVEEE
jgi:peptidoglycan hydrolase FlgJ